MTAAPLIRITNLTVMFPGTGRPAVDGVSLAVHSGECVALVGESGSGKTLTGRAALGMLPRAAIVTGRVELFDENAPSRGSAVWQAIRGAQVALIPQDALGSLDPLRRLQHEVGDALRLHRIGTRGERPARVAAALGAAGMPDPESQLRRRSDQLSGGLRQRALVASALIAEPELIVADEPTTALDATHRAGVIAALAERKRAGAGVLLISHDLDSVRGIADRVLVMRNGHVVEQGDTETVLTHPAHGFTRELIAASPKGKSRERAREHERPNTAPILQLREVSAGYHGTRSISSADSAGSNSGHHVLQHIDLDVHPNETVGLVGESGAGKTTLLRVMLGLHPASSGEVLINGVDRNAASRRTRAKLQQHLAFVPQDPLDSFKPGATAGTVLRDALRAAGTPRHERKRAAEKLASEVDLHAGLIARPVWALSGGQRQRLAIARALAKQPTLLVLDEPVSALDQTVQATVLDLLNRVQLRHGTAMILVSHDTDVIRMMSDRVFRLESGVLRAE